MRPKSDSLAPADLAGNPRATLPCWLRYEHVVLEAYRSSPSTFSFRPETLMPTTCVSRLRDSIRGCLAYNYPISDPSVSHSDLRSWFCSVNFWNDGTHVFVGKKEKNTVPVEITPTKSHGFSFASLLEDELSAFLLLLSRNRIPGPLLVSNPPSIPLPPNVQSLTTANGTVYL